RHRRQPGEGAGVEHDLPHGHEQTEDVAEERARRTENHRTRERGVVRDDEKTCAHDSAEQNDRRVTDRETEIEPQLILTALLVEGFTLLSELFLGPSDPDGLVAAHRCESCRVMSITFLEEKSTTRTSLRERRSSHPAWLRRRHLTRRRAATRFEAAPSEDEPRHGALRYGNWVRRNASKPRSGSQRRSRIRKRAAKVTG